MLQNAGSRPTIAVSVLNLSAPEILQRPAPQPGAPLFGAPRPERPRAPANPDVFCTSKVPTSPAQFRQARCLHDILLTLSAAHRTRWFWAVIHGPRDSHIGACRRRVLVAAVSAQVACEGRCCRQGRGARPRRGLHHTASRAFAGPTLAVTAGPGPNGRHHRLDRSKLELRRMRSAKRGGEGGGGRVRFGRGARRLWRGCGTCTHACV